MSHSDVLVVGAGIAGLAAAHMLATHGIAVTVLEARDRVGGRMHTLYPGNESVPVELGAEFIHGKAAEIFALASQIGLTIYELGGDFWISTHGHLRSNGDRNEEQAAIFKGWHAWRGTTDCSFQTFLEQRFAEPRWRAARESVTRYIEGFNAARADRVSMQWLQLAEKAASAIQGDRAFHLLRGYASLYEWYRDRLHTQQVAIHYETIAKEIHWSQGQVEIRAIAPSGRALPSFTARAAIITLPLGVLDAPSEELAAVRFLPPLPEKVAAMKKLEMGHAIRVIFRFREMFWDSEPSSTLHMPSLHFLTSDDRVMSTWWTAYPFVAPQITGWVGGSRAIELAQLPSSEIVSAALTSLARILGVQRNYLETRLEASYLSNWSQDPFARGAYSYVQVGGLQAPEKLGAPVAQTLFFAGEATNAQGHTGTTHGALATGMRAANEVLSQYGRRG